MSEVREFQAACHCGNVELNVTLPKSIIWTCTCTICQLRGGHWVYVAKPDLTINKGADFLKTYRYNTNKAQNKFCKECGIHIFSQPRSFPDRWALRVECIRDFPWDDFCEEHREFDGFNWDKNITDLRKDEPDAIAK
jgi:hypothetical protein